jgi:hypothetical protein
MRISLGSVQWMHTERMQQVQNLEFIQVILMFIILLHFMNVLCDLNDYSFFPWNVLFIR